VGLIGKILSFTRVIRNTVTVGAVKSDPGGGPNTTGRHYSSPGDDAQPLPGDYNYLAQTPQSGKFASIGYFDPVNPGQSAGGEKRIYARDANTGAVIVELWLKNDGSAVLMNSAVTVTVGLDGSVEADNGSGQFQLEAGGDFVANGAKLTTGGDVVTSDGVSLRNHFHTQPNDSGGDTEQPTAPPTATE